MQAHIKIFKCDTCIHDHSQATIHSPPCSQCRHSGIDVEESKWEEKEDVRRKRI